MAKTAQGKAREKTMIERYGKDWRSVMGKKIKDGKEKNNPKNDWKRERALKGWETRRAMAARKEQILFEDNLAVKIPFSRRISIAFKLIFTGKI